MGEKNPGNLFYTKTHEWLRIEGEQIICGITEHAQEILSDITVIELPATGRKVKAGEPVAVIESAKSVSEVHVPITGEIQQINEELKTRPGLINEDPFGKGWIFSLTAHEPVTPGMFMSAGEYTEYCQG